MGVPSERRVAAGVSAATGSGTDSGTGFPKCPMEVLLADYGRYLSIERALSDHTVLDSYVPAARLFLCEWQAADGLDLERLSAADVSSFLAR